MMMNIFKRVTGLENLLNKVSDNQVLLSKALRAQNLNDPLRPVFTFDGHKCVIDRIDFSGDDHQHYALLIYLDAKTDEYAHQTVPLDSLKIAGETILHSEILRILKGGKGDEDIPSK